MLEFYVVCKERKKDVRGFERPDDPKEAFVADRDGGSCGGG